jgi:AcrR family transcriptional regulator
MVKPTKSNKTDRRIQRTRQALRAALLDLTKEKGYDSISIEEITERANVGRATFYLHYKDKEDLLLEQYSEMADEKVQLFSQIPFSEWLPSGEQASDDPANQPLLPLLMVFQHIYDHSEFYYVLLKSENSSRIVERIRKINTESIVKFAESKIEHDPIPLLFEVPIEFFASFFSGALLSTIIWWLDERMRHSPEEVTLMFRRLFFRGARTTLGLPGDSDAD